MKIILAKNYEDLSKKSAEIIVSQVKEKENSVLGLATGSTPIGMYKEIVKMHKNGQVSFGKVSTVNLDEYRGVDKENNQSYYYYMKEQIFKFIDINTKNTYIPNGMNENSDQECENYEKIIENLGGIDLQILGIGHNGHIGFNEPAEEFSEKTYCVELDERTIQANARFFDSIEDVPKEAYTMGIGTIMSSKKILLLVSGQSKADILYETVLGKTTPKIPSTILHEHENVTIIADEDALSKILKEKPDIIK
ncbi:MAG: glucosamine-6-phosphate deaminase [Clostridia bacterium]